MSLIPDSQTEDFSGGTLKTPGCSFNVSCKPLLFFVLSLELKLKVYTFATNLRPPP
jgi:hypothetical protein